MAKSNRAAKAAADADIMAKVIAAVAAKQGGDALRRVGDRPRTKVEVIPTGSLGLDLALEIGGLPRGRIVEIYGDTGTGKTTLTLEMAANAQAAGVSVAFVDAEHALDLGYAAKLGVDVDNLLLSQPDSGEHALDVVVAICEAAAENAGAPGVPGLVIVDSVAALTPKAELEGEMEDAPMAGQARMMGKAMRKIVAAASKGNVCVVFINQTRQKIGVTYGNPETTTGGNALKFFSSIRIRTGSAGWIEVPAKGGKARIGRRCNAKVEKNKFATPFRHVEYDLIFGVGIDREGEVIDHAVARSVVTHSGAWLVFEGKNIANGRPATKAKLKEDSALCEAIEKALMAHFEAHGFEPPQTAKQAKEAAEAASEPEPPHDPVTGEVLA